MKKGFTIIEVALVLAIGGLIFLMVFVALPGLRASQRDTERRTDVTSLVENIKKFMQNNRGGLPSGTGTIGYDENASGSSWSGFYHDYLGENFKDPYGEQYQLRVVSCGAANVDQECPNGNVSETNFPNNYRISIILQAKCKGERAIQVSNPRAAAVAYKLEGAGTYCADF